MVDITSKGVPARQHQVCPQTVPREPRGTPRVLWAESAMDMHYTHRLVTEARESSRRRSLTTWHNHLWNTWHANAASSAHLWRALDNASRPVVLNVALGLSLEEA